MNEYQDEYIGKNIEIKKAGNKEIIGLKGKIVDETMHTFKVKVDKKTKTILKKNNTFMINNNEIEGNKIIKRPEDRIKIKGR